MWLLTGILIGLGLAWYLFAKGYIPQPRGADAQTAETASGEAAGAAGSAEEVAPDGKAGKRPQYDFFTVLPEMEVVVPEQELSARAQPEADTAGSAAQGADKAARLDEARAVLGRWTAEFPGREADVPAMARAIAAAETR